MTLGDGIVWSTVLILIAGAIYQISVQKKWKLIVKILGVLSLIGALLGGAIWGYFVWTNRPQITTEIGGISLGMTPVEVSLKLGEPSRKLGPIEEKERKPGGAFSSLWLYSEQGTHAPRMMVRFYGPSAEGLTAGIVCQDDGYDSVVGISRLKSEEDVIERLGEPTHVSINETGTAKHISYEQWNASYEIARGRVSAVCLTSSGKVIYGVEYGETEDEPEESSE